MINIEIQLSNQHDMIKRTLFYWSHLYASQLQKNDGYHQLASTITINICNFNVFPETQQYHSSFHLYEDSTMQRLHVRDDVLVLTELCIDHLKFLKNPQNSQFAA